MENLVQAPSHYVWEVAGKPISIHLEFGVVDRLGMEVMRGFGAVPKRGAEVGGLLLGSFEKSDENIVVRVGEFVPVACDYLRGPSFLLTEKDEARFAEAVERAKSGDLALVGFYRSHTRDGLGLTDEDLELFGRYFGTPSEVILLARPFATKTSIGAFFFEEPGGFRRESSYQEFPFRRKDLGGGASPPMRREPVMELPSQGVAGEEAGSPDLRDWIRTQRGEPRPTAPPVEKIQAQSQAPAQFRSRWVWVPLSLVFLVVGLVVGFQGALMLNQGDAERAAFQTLSMGLNVRLENGKAVLRWNRNSPAILHATSGVLRILDGDSSKVVTLDTRQLLHGTVIYMSADSPVNFRLEVTTDQKTVITESADFTPPPAN